MGSGELIATRLVPTPTSEGDEAWLGSRFHSSRGPLHPVPSALGQRLLLQPAHAIVTWNIASPIGGAGVDPVLLEVA